MHTDRTNYIFVDYENVREIDLDLIDGKPVKVIIATGKQQTTLPKELVKQILRFTGQVTLVENNHVGKNALDFVLVFEVAKQAIADPKGFFHIVSKDRGFESLVKYLHASDHLAARIEEFAKIPVLLRTELLSVRELAERYCERLKSLKGSRATRRATLLTQINTFFGKKLDEPKCEAVVAHLVKTNIITLSPTSGVSYNC